MNYDPHFRNFVQRKNKFKEKRINLKEVLPNRVRNVTRFINFRIECVLYVLNSFYMHFEDKQKSKNFLKCMKEKIAFV